MSWRRTVDRARYLRKSMNYAERRLWSRLRNRQLLAKKFRRQHPIGDYIVDFVCLEVRLAVELDGPIHDEHWLRDDQRDRWLAGQGFKILRFTNHQVETDIQYVLEQIGRSLRSLR